MPTYTQHLSANLRPTARLAATGPLEEFVRRHWWKAIDAAVIVGVLLELGKGALNPDYT